MKLVVVESPTKAKTLSRYLGDEYQITASMGHIRDLPKSSLGVDVAKGFVPEYEVSKGKSTVIAALKKAATEAEVIYLATDPDREGEAISWHIQHILSHTSKLKSQKSMTEFLKKFKRVTFHEITKQAIGEALDRPGELNMAMVDAQQARRVVDRLVGYTLSPVLWKKIRRGLSAGRVQSVAVRMIVEREREIKAFIPVEYWDIQARLEGGSKKKEESGGIFLASLVEVDGKRVEIREAKTEDKQSQYAFIDSEKTAQAIVADLEAATYSVSKVVRKEMKRQPYPPYTTSTLQQAAANVLGWSGKQTMRIAQDLYEAGLITYHRTDSFHLAGEAVSVARGLIEADFGSAYVPDKPQFYQTKSKNAQEAHEAIRPTKPNLTQVSEEMNEATERHQKLYQLIWRRFVACQMMPALYDQTTIKIEARSKKKEEGIHSSTYLLHASGSVVKFDGWRRVYQQKQEVGSKKKEDEVILPLVNEGEGLDLKEVVSEQKFTQPPPRYNDASLVKELERRGIGRPSTYASILSTIVDRGYVERLDKRYQPTTIGETVNDFLVAQFPIVMDYEFTAGMEEDLDRISLGEKQWQAVMKAFWQPFEKQVKLVSKESGRVEIPVEKTGTPCPKCEVGELVIRSGRFGKFMSCGRFPECDYKASIKQTVEGVLCPDCKGEIVLKRTRTGRTFWGCSQYPTCKWASWQDPSKKTEK
jgi:DNA topoisomerase-1